MKGLTKDSVCIPKIWKQNLRHAQHSRLCQQAVVGDGPLLCLEVRKVGNRDLVQEAQFLSVKALLRGVHTAQRLRQAAAAARSVRIPNPVTAVRLSE